MSSQSVFEVCQTQHGSDLSVELLRCVSDAAESVSAFVLLPFGIVLMNNECANIIFSNKKLTYLLGQHLSPGEGRHQ